MLIVSSNGLFREGLKHVLAGTADLDQAQNVCTLQEAEELVSLGQANIVIFASSDNMEGAEISASTISPLLSRPGVRVIVASLNEGGLTVYRRERVDGTSVDDLVAALSNGC